ncbi:exo-alpha-sialidase [Parapedobacter sp. ISTM3]|uniref:sialidase family protein n=1 Tax=Parapedobacter sp. ISTM3 TaxID=2800130 RepID=UPI00190678F2|nr:sialidase family protein [Parapedobacter sp. ISTM3]MBK1439072.1 exo-alpha-sialidase [Parapedobacter sp. ISTM3]
MFYKSIITIALIICFGTDVRAQFPDSTKVLAAVVPEKADKVGIARKGAPIFADERYVFKQLPRFLRGSGYIIGSMAGRNRIVPVTTGSLFVVTPLAGEPGSQEPVLHEQGFIKLDHPSFTLFSGQEVQIGIFKKDIVYDNFRLKDVRYEGWAVAFFDARPLPSITEPAQVSWLPGIEYGRSTRKWQGCPSITKTGTRLWAAWFSGGTREPDAGNYGIISYSDDGKEWVDPAMVITHPNSAVRVMDPQLWKDPQGRLWIFWVQNTGPKGFDGIWGTWAVRIDNPTSDKPTWTSPRRLCDGLTRNKPIVLASGKWLLPSYDWINHQSAVYISDDEGEHWTLQGGPLNKPISNFYEHMCVQLTNGNIWMLQRNVQESISDDQGKSWTSLQEVEELTSANSRLYIGRLQSGNLLLVYNNDPTRKARKNMTARLSLDDGQTWPYELLLDERNNVSYPDVVQDDDGLIYVCYDRSRGGEKEILMAAFTEEDIKQGRFVGKQAKQKQLISKADD